MKKTIARPTMLKKIFFAVLVVVLFVVSMYGVRCGVYKVCEMPFVEKWIRNDVVVLLPKGAIQAEVANTKASRERGLSGRESMADNEGLLFIFEHPGRYGFWMKNMKFPLDIIWINDEGVVVHIERDLGPESYPQAFINSVNALYVLEINAGLSNKYGVYLGTKVKITE